MTAPPAGRRRCPQCATPAARETSRFCTACGAPLTTARPTDEGTRPDPTDEHGSRRGRTRRRRWRALAVFGGLIVASTAVTAGLHTTQETVYSPEEPVEELLEAIADRDGDRAAELLDSDSSLITSRALQEGYTPPTDMRITKFEYGHPLGGLNFPAEKDPEQRPERDIGAVYVNYTVDGEENTTWFLVQREKTGMLREWELGALQPEHLGEVEVTSRHVPSVKVASLPGVTTGGPLLSLAANDPLPALPGTYNVSIEEENELFEEGALGELHVTARSSLTDDEPATFDVDELEVRSDVVKEVESQIDADLDDCEASTNPLPSPCPFRFTQGGVYKQVESVEWTILERPTVQVTPAGEDAMHTNPVTVAPVTSGKVRAEVTFQREYHEPETETMEFSVKGSAAIEDGEVAWKPR